MKKSGLLSNILVVLPLAVCAFVTACYLLLTPVVKQKQGVVYDLHAGKSKQTLIHDLVTQGIIHHPWVLALYIYPQHKAQLKTGEYLFPEGASMRTIWRQVTTGTGLYYRPFTIIPGRTFSELKQMLIQAPQLAQTVSTMTTPELMTKLGYPSASPEGEFMPDTYFYTKGDTDFSILKRAFDLMQTKFAIQWVARSGGLPYKSPYEALIAASLVEKEAYLDKERRIIAGVIINRLNKNMLLQIDPTVIYGLGDKYTGKITKQDLRTDTPYNTYTRKGLPPTPIAMPSMSSIQAVLHPSRHEYLYFVARGDGSHQFSTSLVEHNAAVAAAALAKQKKDHFFNESMLQKYMSAQLSV